MTTRSRGSRISRLTLAVYGVLALLFLSGPLLVIVPMSFSNSGGLTFPPPGWSMRWYHELFSKPEWANAVELSLLVGFAATAISVALGSLAAYGLVRSKARGVGGLLALFLAPLIVPPIVTAVGLSLAFSQYGLRGTVQGIIVGHCVIVTPYVVLLMVVAFQSFDFRLEQMARSLGAGWFRSFRTVVLPVLGPSIAATSLISFAVSLDEVIVTSFVAGTDNTVPTLMFSQLRDRIDPTVTALSTVLIAFTLILMAIGGWIMTRSKDASKVVKGLATDTTPTEKVHN